MDRLETASASVAAERDGGIGGGIALLGLALGAIAGGFAIATSRRRRPRSAR